jgi:hypothetical protein
MPTTTSIIPIPPAPFTLAHHAWKAGANAEHIATSMSADANPAAKLLTFGFSDGRYRKPDPEECGGIMKMSYFPGGKPEDLGTSPCGGGGGGALFILAVRYTSTIGVSQFEKLLSTMSRDVFEVDSSSRVSLQVVKVS